MEILAEGFTAASRPAACLLRDSDIRDPPEETQREAPMKAARRYRHFNL